MKAAEEHGDGKDVPKISRQSIYSLKSFDQSILFSDGYSACIGSQQAKKRNISF